MWGAGPLRRWISWPGCRGASALTWVRRPSGGAPMGDVISAEGLTKSYGAERGVIDLSFAVAPGEVFGYLGPNGAGKTTTIRTLLDFIRPTAGQARIFDLDSTEGSIEIHRRTGYLPGELALYERMTAADYLTHFAALRGGVDWADVRRLAERLDLRLETRIQSLSHGNKQKVGLVQAFMHNPELLVLDEPTSGLDPLVQQEFHAMVREARQQGQTIFLSSHVLSEVQQTADTVAILRDGKIIAVESVSGLREGAVRHLRFTA